MDRQQDARRTLALIVNRSRAGRREYLRIAEAPIKSHPDVIEAEISETRWAQSDSIAELKKRNHDGQNEIVAKPCQIVTS